VALARALVNRPRVLLLDEPLGALDLKLRQEMQVELRALQRQVGITFLYVTHDQEEALGMSDRLAVFRDGRVEQVGTPAEVYETPRTTFVAGFVGASNTLSGPLALAAAGSPEPFLVRPEKMRLLGVDDAVEATECSLLGTVVDASYLGPVTRYRVAADAGGEVFVLATNRTSGAEAARGATGRRVRVSWDLSMNRKAQS
jgi:putative spermidine/putrescine transport system ATP-binding protein